MNIAALNGKELKLLLEDINKDPEFQLASRHTFLELALGYGLDYFDPQLVFTIAGGQIVKIEPILEDRSGLTYSAPQVTIKGTPEFWGKFLTPMPPPYFNNCSSGSMLGSVVISGSEELHAAYFWAIFRLMEVMRIVLVGQQKP